MEGAKYTIKEGMQAIQELDFREDHQLLDLKKHPKQLHF